MILGGFAEAKTIFGVAEVLAAVDRDTKRDLAKWAAYVRVVARNSIKKGSGISQPGAPPISHAKQNIKKILYAWDESLRAYVVGPVIFQPAKAQPGAKQLEEGGKIVAKDRDGKTTLMMIRARPFMQPALKKSIAAGKDTAGYLE